MMDTTFCTLAVAIRWPSCVQLRYRLSPEVDTVAVFLQLRVSQNLCGGSGVVQQGR